MSIFYQDNNRLVHDNTKYTHMLNDDLFINGSLKINLLFVSKLPHNVITINKYNFTVK